MRSRTEMVTTTLDGSDFEEDSDFEDSEEDWKPEKGDPKHLKRKSRDIITGTVTGGGRRGAAGRNNGKKQARKPATKSRSGRKRKSDSPSEDDDDEDEDDDLSDSEDSGKVTPPPRKRGKNAAAAKGAGAKGKGGRKSIAKASPSSSKGAPGLEDHHPGFKLEASGVEGMMKPIQRKVVNMASSFPDKSGYLKLFAFRGDLEEGIRDNLKLCLWRRDGSSLLQKYFRDKSVDANTPQFTSSMVYSCWEDKRSDEYMEVKVRCIEQTKQLRVRIIDIDATDKKAKEEYEKFIAEHDKFGLKGLKAAIARKKANGNASGTASGSRKSKTARDGDNEEEEEEEEDNDDDDDEDDEDEDEDEDEDDNGDGDGDEHEEDQEEDEVDGEEAVGDGEEEEDVAEAENNDGEMEEGSEDPSEEE